MKKVILAAAFVMGLATVSFAGNPKETKDAKTEVSKSEPSATESTVETEEFYVDNAGNRISTVYPTLGDCEPSATENCHATYTRQDANSPWVLQGTIQKGIKPF